MQGMDVPGQRGGSSSSFQELQSWAAEVQTNTNDGFGVPGAVSYQG